MKRYVLKCWPLESKQKSKMQLEIPRTFGSSSFQGGDRVLASLLFLLYEWHSLNVPFYVSGCRRCSSQFEKKKKNIHNIVRASINSVISCVNWSNFTSSGFFFFCIASIQVFDFISVNLRASFNTARTVRGAIRTNVRCLFIRSRLLRTKKHSNLICNVLKYLIEWQVEQNCEQKSAINLFM